MNINNMRTLNEKYFVFYEAHIPLKLQPKSDIGIHSQNKYLYIVYILGF